MIAPWIVKRHKVSVFRVEGCYVRPFMEVAVTARERQILALGRATVLSGDNMLGMEKHQPRGRLWQATVLTDVTRPGANFGTKLPIHRLIG